MRWGMQLPNLLIIGAMKCGTTSLHNYLDAHPDIFMSREKEIRFFVATGENERWSRGLDWYRSHFRTEAPVRGESTPEYTKLPFFPGVAGRIHRTLPDVKLIYMVRDPMARLVSHYLHRIGRGTETGSLAEAVDRHAGLTTASSYAMQLKEYLRFFPKERIRVVCFEDLLKEPARIMRELFEFVGVDANFESDVFAQPFHKNRLDRPRRPKFFMAMKRHAPVMNEILLRTPPPLRSLLFKPVERPQIDDEVRAELSARFKDEVAWLREFSGQKFASWSV